MICVLKDSKVLPEKLCRAKLWLQHFETYSPNRFKAANDDHSLLVRSHVRLLNVLKVVQENL